MIAALFVDQKGPYVGRIDIDPWTAERDARLYAGPYPVVAHPPCERWGRYATGGPSAKIKRRRGDDGGCFAAALGAVRRWGGVLEHPADSAAWAAFSLIAPPLDGGWVAAGDFIGWTCRVEQGHYGHRARKATWLYAAGVRALPSLKWGPSTARARREGVVACERLSKLERRLTPAPFAELLIGIALVAAKRSDEGWRSPKSS